MAESSIEDDILEEIHKLQKTEQERVLEFARSLVKVEPRGVPGKHLLRFVGTINKDDLEEMAQSIEEDCERVDHSEW